MRGQFEEDQAVPCGKILGTISQPGIVGPQPLIINLNEEQTLLFWLLP